METEKRIETRLLSKVVNNISNIVQWGMGIFLKGVNDAMDQNYIRFHIWVNLGRMGGGGIFLHTQRKVHECKITSWELKRSRLIVQIGEFDTKLLLLLVTALLYLELNFT